MKPGVVLAGIKTHRKSCSRVSPGGVQSISIDQRNEGDYESGLKYAHFLWNPQCTVLLKLDKDMNGITKERMVKLGIYS